MKNFNSVREELLYLSEKNKGLLSPQKIVMFAENPKTNLHSKFEWDNEKAGHEYRLWQARKIISLEFEIIKEGTIEAGPVRLFVSLKDDRNKEGGYRLITNVITDEVRKQQMLNEALSELRYFREKYKVLQELTDVFSAIEKAQSLIFAEKE
jgi:hypothetical protein